LSVHIYTSETGLGMWCTWPWAPSKNWWAAHSTTAHPSMGWFDTKHRRSARLYWSPDSIKYW